MASLDPYTPAKRGLWHTGFRSADRHHGARSTSSIGHDELDIDSSWLVLNNATRHTLRTQNPELLPSAQASPPQRSSRQPLRP